MLKVEIAEVLHSKVGISKAKAQNTSQLSIMWIFCVPHIF